jgi:hypothetical protein
MIAKGNGIIEHTKRLKALLIRNGAFTDWETRLDIMTYELGEAVKFYKVYSKAYGEDENIVNGYEAEGMLALSNLTVQLEMFCIRKGIDFNELSDLGYEHLLLKMKEVHEKGGSMI